YKNNMNVYRSDVLKYKEGNKIFFNTENFNISRPYAKFIPLFESPFEILKANSYWVILQFLINIKYSPTFYINKVKL
ncbi:hypothetical protein NEUTE2DRAFT_73288, partial [Neurospora tetrasperma FGSC 2509]